MGIINEEMIENLSKKDLSYSQGSTRQAFLVQNSILKLPRYSDKFDLSFKYDVNDIIKFNVYLRGINQMLKEIQIYEEGLFNDIVVPIEEYGVLNGQLYTLNKKIMPSNICLDDEDFNLQYFCIKMGCLEDYPYLIDRIEELAFHYNLDINDLIENEDNFGYDYNEKKVLLLDYGFNEEVDYGDAAQLLKSNKENLKKYIQGGK